MDIVQRNFLRLLRCGAFERQEAIEPMSPYKWRRLYQLSRIHGVTPWITDGIRRCHDDFFLQVPANIEQLFENDQTEQTEERTPQKLTNPLLNRQLRQIADSSREYDYTYLFLQDLIAASRNILTQGINLRQFIMLGTYLRYTKDPIDNERLQEWIKRLKLGRIVRLVGSLLTELFCFEPEHIVFTDATLTKSTQKAVNDMFLQTEKQAAEWYFTQGKSIFVRSSDSGAMIWHMKHSLCYIHYYPSEAITNFLSNIAHSLSHIEE